ncbi:MAG: GTPase, partial [Pseudomonadota bacterium]
FTTLAPNLGVIAVEDGSFVLADIPGLIEGASEGKGLGDRFLGHVERTNVLLHLIDGTQDDVVGAYQTVRGELEAYGDMLADKPELVALNKIDALDDEMVAERKAALEQASGSEVFAMSGAAQLNIKPVLYAVWQQIQRGREQPAEAVEAPWQTDQDTTLDPIATDNDRGDRETLLD